MKQNTISYYDRKVANKYNNYIVKEDSELLPFLMTSINGISRTKAKEYLTNKMIYIDKKIITQYNYPLKKGQVVQICKRRNIHDFHNKFVEIIYEDAFIIVVNKKNGILTNTQPGMRQMSVKSILDEYVKRQNRTMSVHTVHRLDRETSGLLIFAKRRDIQQKFNDYWQELVPERKYIAVVEGVLEKPAGTVSSWLADNKMFVTHSSVVDNGGKYAVTHYKTIKTNSDFSLVELTLETGRKNQIRVHMQDLHHPIVGDMKYGSSIDPVGRICLHSYKIKMLHPITNESLSFDLPVPSVFNNLFNQQKE